VYRDLVRPGRDLYVRCDAPIEKFLRQALGYVIYVDLTIWSCLTRRDMMLYIITFEQELGGLCIRLHGINRCVPSASHDLKYRIRATNRNLVATKASMLVEKAAVAFGGFAYLHTGLLRTSPLPLLQLPFVVCQALQRHSQVHHFQALLSTCHDSLTEPQTLASRSLAACAVSNNSVLSLLMLSTIPIPAEHVRRLRHEPHQPMFIYATVHFMTDADCALQR
jgi:hypothetical protein